MKKLFACLLLAPALSFAQTPFDGTWVANLKTSQLSPKPEIFLLNKGMYSCPTCVPRVDVKADGQDHKVTGSHYLNSAAIEVVDDHTIKETDKQDGKVVYTNVSTISADGKTLTAKFEDFAAKLVSGEEIYTRVSSGPVGSHAISGSWRAEKISNISNNGFTVTYASMPNGIKMSETNGEGYDAKFDGKQYAIQNDPGHTTVRISKVGTRTLVETYTQDGKVISTFRVTVDANGRMMSVIAHDIEQDRTNHFTLEKKS